MAVDGTPLGPGRTKNDRVEEVIFTQGFSPQLGLACPVHGQIELTVEVGGVLPEKSIADAIERHRKSHALEVVTVWPFWPHAAM